MSIIKAFPYKLTTLFFCALFFGNLTDCFSQIIVTPNIGINLAGDLEFRRGGFGGAIGYIGKKLGVEIEFMRHHHFFKDSKLGYGNTGDPMPDEDTDAMIFTANLLLPYYKSKNQKLDVYGSTGVGLYHSWIDSGYVGIDGRQNDFGMHLGTGLWYNISKRISLRNDLRYSYVLNTHAQTAESFYNHNYGFLRYTVGITVKLK
jgi:opacity protein-like surface antigen